MNALTTPRRIDAFQTSDVENLPTFDARDLVNNGVQARIVLDQQIYVLRITRAGKLILTK